MTLNDADERSHAVGVRVEKALTEGRGITILLHKVSGNSALTMSIIGASNA